VASGLMIEKVRVTAMAWFLANIVVFVKFARP